MGQRAFDMIDNVLYHSYTDTIRFWWNRFGPIFAAAFYPIFCHCRCLTISDSPLSFIYRHDPVLVEPVRPDLRRRDPQEADGSNAPVVALSVAPR